MGRRLSRYALAAGTPTVVSCPPSGDYEPHMFIPTGVITFFKTGPFTYGGLLGFYVPLAVFAVWLVAMPYAVIRAIRGEVAE